MHQGVDQGLVFRIQGSRAHTSHQSKLIVITNCLQAFDKGESEIKTANRLIILVGS